MAADFLPLVDPRFNAFLQLFCECGWLAQQGEGNTVYCANSRCPHRATLFEFSVVVKEVGQKGRA